MNREDILEASRKENRNRDFVEMETTRIAGNCSAAIGTAACLILSILASYLADTILYSPWFIYFSMVGTAWLVRSIRLKKKSDWVLTALFFILAMLALAGFTVRLAG